MEHEILLSAAILEMCKQKNRYAMLKSMILDSIILMF
jgi:hypothetical protein